MLDLSLPIKRLASLYTFWTRCTAYVRARKQLTIHEAPNILTIVLKRFQVSHSSWDCSVFCFVELLFLTLWSYTSKDNILELLCLRHYCLGSFVLLFVLSCHRTRYYWLLKSCFFFFYQVFIFEKDGIYSLLIPLWWYELRYQLWRNRPNYSNLSA